MSSPSVSIIIPTYNGAHKIQNVLKALEVQTLPYFEVIIVVDGSTDNTISLLTSTEFNINIKILNRINGGRSVARNAGAQAAQGELLIFFDDDMQPLECCVEAHVKHHSLYSNSISVGTQEEYETDEQTDFQRFKSYIVKKWIAALPAYGTSIDKVNTYVTAANFSISKYLFDLLGRFDERLTDAEDFELGTRAIEKGIYIYYNPLARAFHDDPITCYSYIRRQREYSRAHHNLHKIRPEIVGRYNNAKEYKPVFIKRTIFSLFANKFFVYTIDHLNFYRFLLPKQARYKLYDVVVWGMAKVFPERQL